MLVTILNSMSGPTEVYTGGQQYDVPDRRALALISRGLATAVEVEVQPPQGNEDESTDARPVVEQAIKRRGRPKR